METKSRILGGGGLVEEYSPSKTQSFEKIGSSFINPGTSAL
jgi:hypothetical protein